VLKWDKDACQFVRLTIFAPKFATTKTETLLF